MPDFPVVNLVDANGNIVVPASQTSANPGVVRLEDGVSTNTATVAQFHNADNQSPGGTAYGLLTGGVAQLLNISGNLDRQRETGTDGIAAVGVTTGAAQFAMSFLTTDSTDNLAAGVRTFTPVAMSGTVNAVPWSIQVGSVLTLDSGANAEPVTVTAVTATTFTCTTAKAHNGTVTPFAVTGFVYNQERDASGELDGATGSGTAVAAEYEYNGGGAGSSNYDRARNLQGKGLSAAVSWTGTLTAPVTSFTATSAPTGLGPGQPVFFYNTSTGAVTEVVYTALNYVAGSTSIVLKSATVSNHNSAAEALRYDVYAAAGPALNGFLPTGLGIEEEALYEPVSGLYYIERSATQDNADANNIVMESEALATAFGATGRGMERARSVLGKQLVGSANFTNKAQNGGNLTLTAPGAAGATSLVFSADPSVATFNGMNTPLRPGMAVYLCQSPAAPTQVEVVYVTAAYTGGATVPVTATQISHTATTDAAWESFGPTGPALTGFLPSGMDLDEDAVYDPITGLYYLERAATADAMAGTNIVAEHSTLYNGATFDRWRGAQGTAFVTVGGSTTAAIASGTSTNTVVKAAAGRLCRVMVSALAGATTGNTTIYDNASAASGTALIVIPNATAVGTILDIQMPAANGITVGGNANAPGVTISFA